MIARLAAPLVGVGLVALCLYLAGWSDRVTTADGAVLFGRIVEHTETSVLLQADGTTRRVALQDPADAREGLASAFRRFAQQPGAGLSAFVLFVAGMLLGFVRWGLLLRASGVATSYRDAVRLAWTGQFASNLLPGGASSGDLVKALLAAHRAGGRGRARALLSVLADRLVGVFVLSCVAGVAAFVAPDRADIGTAGRVVAGVLSVCALGLIVLLSSRLRRWLGLSWLAQRIPGRAIFVELGVAARLYGGRRGAVALAAAMALLGQALMLGALWFLGGAVGTWMGWAAIGVAVPVALLVSAVPALPGGWGVGDAAFWYFLTRAGVPASHAIALSFLFRVMHLVSSLPGAWTVGAAERRAVEPPRGGAET